MDADHPPEGSIFHAETQTATCTEFGTEFGTGYGTTFVSLNATTQGDDPTVWLKPGWKVTF